MHISCDEEPMITRDYRVTQKGFVLIDFIGAVKVQGMSKSEAAQAVSDQLVNSKVLRKATVKVDETAAATTSPDPTINGSSVQWAGEVENPGSVRFRSGLTLADVWPNVRARVGADLTQVVITNPKAATRTVSLAPQTDLRGIYLAAGDTINVGPRSTLAGKATVNGEVEAPGSVDIGPYTTLGEIVGRSGGLKASG
ncbi:MAG: SLBB domain-containing protein, partial [Armatimonadota bacterium]